jgi:cell shape-determining protein MreD
MITPQAFIAERLGATLLLNSVMMLVLSWPLDRFAQFIVRTDERKYRQSF